MHRALQLLAAILGCWATMSATLPAAPQGSGPTVRWEVDDLGANWIGSSVALGDDGSVLIAARRSPSTEIVIHSTASADPIGGTTVLDAPYAEVAAARHGQTLAAITSRQVGTATGIDVYPVLRVWNTARAGFADWTFDFPVTQQHASTGMDVLISEDGERIVAWYADRIAGLLRIRVFDAAGSPLLVLDVVDPLGEGVSGWGGAITPDASRLLIDVSSYSLPQLYDLTTGSLVASWPQRSERGGLALSRDGRSVAIGDMNRVDVYRESSTGIFGLFRSYTLQGSRYGGPLALDDDGTHLAFSVNWDTPQDKTQIRTYDLVADIELWRQEVVAPAAQSGLHISRVRMTDDAERVAAASWGDDASATPTGFVFDHNGVPLSLFRTEGSALDMDWDPAAEVVAFATQDTHIIGFGGGGDIICADTRPTELRVAGVPRAGELLELTVQGPGTHTRLALGPELGSSPTPHGVSQLDLSRLYRFSDAVPLSGGMLFLQKRVPGLPGLQGSPLHLQAALIDTATGMGLLSNRVSVRVLP